MANHQTIEFIQGKIQDVLHAAGIEARIMYEDSLVNGLVFNIQTRDAKILIGHQGSVLHALEHLVHAIVARSLAGAHPDQTERTFFSIDIDDYKKNRQIQIKQLVKDAVSDVKRSGTPAKLPVMSNYERRFVHTYVQEQFPHVTTESVGIDPNRYIKLSV